MAIVNKKALIEIFNKQLDEEGWINTKGDVTYRISKPHKTLILEFQCSNGWKDWFRNLFFKKVPYKGMSNPFKVHAGFLSAWKEIEDIIRDRIRERDYTAISIIGYSHGGAIAGLCLECANYERPDLASDHRIIALCYESPRFYAGGLSKEVKRMKFRGCYVLRNGWDLVTHLPPLLFGFKHVGKLTKFGKEKRCIKAHTPQSVLEGLNSLPQDFCLNTAYDFASKRKSKKKEGAKK